MKNKKKVSPNTLAGALRAFFGDYLPTLRGVSRHTVLSYRDTLVLLLRYVAESRRVELVTLEVDNVTSEQVIAFLNYLEQVRKNKTSSRNVRLAAIHAFFRYVAIYSPDRMEQSQRILGIPFKRAGSRPIDYPEYDEICALLNTVNRKLPDGLRDYALISLMFNTGARVQEVVDLNANDLQLEHPLQLKLRGKGQKIRICPLWPQTAQVLRQHLSKKGLDTRSSQAVFSNYRGERLTRFGVRYILAKHWQNAAKTMPSLVEKRIHPHSLRHGCSMHLLKSGVDLPSIAHWLGHASINTTNRYAKADLEMKRLTISSAQPPSEASENSWRETTGVIDWLESL